MALSSEGIGASLIMHNHGYLDFLKYKILPEFWRILTKKLCRHSGAFFAKENLNPLSNYITFFWAFRFYQQVEPSRTEP